MFNKFKVLILGSVFMMAVGTSCNDCYLCQSFMYLDSTRMVDFREECGDQEARDEMEDDFRADYPQEGGYTVTCR